MSHLHLTQIGFFKPILSELKDKGVNFQKLLNSSGLSHYNLEDENKYVPLKNVYGLFNAIHQQEGIDDFIEEFAGLMKLTSLSQWSEMIAYTPDILTACQKAEKYNGVLLTHEHAGFDVNSQNSIFWQYFDDQPGAGRRQTEFLCLALAINSFQLAAGDSWAPLEIHIQSNRIPNLDKLLPPGYTTKIYLNQPRTAIVFPTSILTLPMLGKKEHSNHINYNPNTTNSIANNIERILDSNEEIPSINYVAEISDLSVRSLQRRLLDEQVTYSDIIDNWRFKRALDLLKDSKNSVTGISKVLRYSNLPNFVRAFSRWTNSTPQQYRENI